MPATPEQLKARWQTEDGERRLAQVIELARRGEDWEPVLKGFPFADEVENGLDIRAANLSDCVYSGQLKTGGGSAQPCLDSSS